MVDVEKNNDYASKGVAGAGLGLGIAGTALGLLNGGLGVLGNGGNARTSAAVDVAIPSMAGILAGLAGSRESCSENTGVNRYELSQNEKMAQKDMEIAYWRGQDETNRKISDAYSKLESRIIGLSAEVRANKDEQAGINLQQAVYNGTNTAAIGCIQNQVNALLGMTKTVIPNSSVCPGWGAATVTVSTGTTTT